MGQTACKPPKLHHHEKWNARGDPERKYPPEISTGSHRRHTARFSSLLLKHVLVYRIAQLVREHEQRTLSFSVQDALRVRLEHGIEHPWLQPAPGLFTERLKTFLEVAVGSAVATHDTPIRQSTIPAAVRSQTTHGMMKPPGRWKTSLRMVIHHRAPLNGNITHAGGPQISQSSSPDNQPGANRGMSMISGSKKIQTGTAMAATISMRPPPSKYKS